jgi:cytochrome c553
MCRNCHFGGQGADTDVFNGVYVTGGHMTSPFTNYPHGETNAVLLGGGFEHVGGSGGLQTTSTHSMENPSGDVPPGSTSKQVIVLSCTSCHSGHRDMDHPDQYRVLRVQPGDAQSPIDVLWNGPWDDQNETSNVDPNRTYRAYTEHDFDPATPGVQFYTKNYKQNISNWCTGCHTRYLATDDNPQYKSDPGYDAGDGSGVTRKYRHSMEIPIVGRFENPFGAFEDFSTDLPLEDVNVTANPREDEDLLNCLTCHRAHGTEKTMEGHAALPASNRGTLPSGQDSTLLRKNNRGVCVTCHKMDVAY